MSNLGREYSDVMILQPTSPFRSAEDIDQAWNSFQNSNAKTLLSVTEAGKYASNFMYEQLADLNSNSVALSSLNGKSLLPIRRQDLEVTWWRNGAIYICKSENITNLNQIIVEPIIGHIMPWHKSVNIDDEQDLFYAEYIWNSALLGNGL
jgi:CMP-N-acetylneuraminic acid synthetase